MNRRTKYGSAVQPEEAISVMDAIRMQTIWAAFAGFQDNDKGSIEIGKLADLVIVSGDPLTASHDRLADMQTDVTIVDGKVAYQRSGCGSAP